MRRLPFIALVSLTIPLTASPSAQAWGHILFHGHHGRAYSMSPVAPVAPITPGQILLGLQLAQQGYHFIQGIVHDTRQNQPQTQPHCQVSSEVFSRLNASGANLKSAVDGTNSLMEAVRANDPRFADKLKGKIEFTSTPSAEGGPKLSPVPKPKE